ncbi:MAG: LacI family DNA-binding transcriptional regulator [Anaerolineales bacterium]|nr:LacI family DNA-binding transcriptional regulator [Anaerolineales bacterium]
MAATLKDIAQHLGISITTVSRGLAGYSDVAKETQVRIAEAAQALGYQPNITARRLKKQRTDTLGFILPTFGPRFSDPFFSEFIAGIGNKAAEHDFDLLVSTHAPYSDDERRAYERATQRGWVDGLIVIRTREKDDRIRHLSEHNFPFVVFGRTNLDLDYPFVDEDSAAGMRLLTQHFIDLGHRRIGFMMPPKELMFSNFRLQGYQETMRENGLPIESDWIVTGNLTQRGGAEVVDRLLNVRPRLTAIICSNDLMAIGAISRIQEYGLQAGKDIAIAGFDDVPTAAYANPSLTTVAQPIYDIGRRTCAMLIDLINGRSLEQRHVLLTPELVIRASSGTPIE